MRSQPVSADRRPQPELVSVVIAVHNGIDLLGDQLDALVAQTYRGAVEVIVADNRSTDGLDDSLRRYPHAGALRLRRVDASERAGAGYARNKGVAESAGDFIAFCDHDDRVHPGWLEHLIALAPEHAAVGGGLETATLNSADVRRWRQLLPPDVPNGFPGFLRWSPTCNLGIWRDAFDGVGGFDLAYAEGGEDADLTFRVQLAGGSLGFAPDALIAYRLRDTLIGLWKQSVMFGEGDARLFAGYHRHGMPRRHWLATVDVIAYAVIRNPLLPSWLTRAPRGAWVFHTGNLVGRIKGSLRHRCFYV